MTAQQVEPLVAEVVAKVTGQDGKPLLGAAPTAIADMVEMPCAHTTDPPVPLEAIPDQPGAYRGRVEAPMVGTYGVLVRLDGDVEGEGATSVPLGLPD